MGGQGTFGQRTHAGVTAGDRVALRTLAAAVTQTARAASHPVRPGVAPGMQVFLSICMAPRC